MPVGGKNQTCTVNTQEKSAAVSITYEQIKASRPPPIRNSQLQKHDPYLEIEERPLKGLNMNFEDQVTQKIGK